MGLFSYASKVEPQRGAALLLVIMTLLLIALGALNISARQIMVQHEMLSLEFRRVERQRVTEQLFENIVLLNQQTTEATQWLEQLHSSSAIFNQLSARREVVSCPHPYKTTSVCSRIRVQHASTGFVRERLLVQPISHCAKPYWYAPAARVGSHIDMGPMPDPPPPLRRPDLPEPPPPSRPGLRGFWLTI